MLCQNCGKNEANIRYTQIINGVKKQMTLCSNCAEELGLEDIGFDMPIDFSSFLGDVFEDTSTSFIPDIINTKSLTCDKCHMTYEDFIEQGKIGCGHCYEIFENKMDSLLKSIQSSNKHVGRLGKITVENNVDDNKTNIQDNKKKINEVSNKEEELEDKIKDLQDRLNQEIREERYEDAAKTRDEIKKLQGK